jgi:uncharacterized membrane protein
VELFAEQVEHKRIFAFQITAHAITVRIIGINVNGDNLPLNGKSKAISVRTGWSLVILLVLVLLAFAGKRLFDTFSGVPHQNLFELRYLEHPVTSTLHMLSGILFVLLAPLQFFRKFRSKNLGLHRSLGKFLVVCALISGLYGITSVIVLPAFGGLASETAGWFFGIIFVFSIVRAYFCARNKNIAAHREWMIRAFSVGLAVGTQRILLALFIITTDYGFAESFGPTLWLGFSINLLIAETWINLSRVRS